MNREQFDKALQHQLCMALTQTLAKTSVFQVGELRAEKQLNFFTHKLLHGMVGGATGLAMNPRNPAVAFASGAGGAMVASIAMEWMGEVFETDNLRHLETQVGTASAASALAVGLAGGDPIIASDVGYTAAKHNDMVHRLDNEEEDYDAASTDITVLPAWLFNRELPTSESTQAMRFLYRGTVTSPDVVFERGFLLRGSNMDIFAHVRGENGSGFISTSKSKNVALNFSCDKSLEYELYVYQINPQKTGVDAFEQHKPMLHRLENSVVTNVSCEQEISVPGRILRRDIKGVSIFQSFDDPTEAEILRRTPIVESEKFVLNPHYVPPLYTRIIPIIKISGHAFLSLGLFLDARHLMKVYDISKKTEDYGYLKHESSRVAGGLFGSIIMGLVGAKLGAGACALIAPPYGPLACAVGGGLLYGALGCDLGDQTGGLVYRRMNPNRFFQSPGIIAEPVDAAVLISELNKGSFL